MRLKLQIEILTKVEQGLLRKEGRRDGKGEELTLRVDQSDATDVFVE